ncbi:MAG: hypothetical protein R3C49_27870 [Planctomycetaceae bacterium]
MKIRDELAGTSAKCPKCQTAFVVPAVQAIAPNVAAALKSAEKKPAQAPRPANSKKPNPVTAGAASSGAAPSATPSAMAVGVMELPVDMPLEVTPPVRFAAGDSFDPLDVLGGPVPSSTASQGPATSSGSSAEIPKPSIADLMREHEATKKKKKERKQKTGPQIDASVTASVMTAGTAADALTRTYDQKRGKASEPAPLTREEQRQLEYREGMRQAAIKGVAGLFGILVLGYLFVAWMNSASLPDLEYVSGVVTLKGQPLANVQVMFAPVQLPGEPPRENYRTSQGNTNQAGEYVLMYDMENEGVLPGPCNVTIMASSGIMYTLPTDRQQVTVSEDQDNQFNFSLE